MLPLVINNSLSRLVQVTLTGSVGAGGRNHPDDVRLIQALLNATGSAEGGPEIQLVVDGLSGTYTVGAIRRFQQKRRKLVDGRVDPLGPTIRALVSLLHDRNALPRGLHNIGPPKPEIIRALNSRYSVGMGAATPSEPRPGARAPAFGASYHPNPLGGRLTASSPTPSMSYVGPTGWEIKTSGGLSISITYFGGAIANIYMKHDTDPMDYRYRFVFVGAGVGLSTLPVGFDISGSDMPSRGTKVWKVNPISGKAPPIHADDLLGPAMILTGELSGGIAGSGSGVWFHGNTYLSFYYGAQVGMPGGGISAFVGWVTGGSVG